MLDRNFILNDLEFWIDRLKTEEERLVKLLEFSKGVEHSATIEARRNIKKYVKTISDIKEEIVFKGAL